MDLTGGRTRVQVIYATRKTRHQAGVWKRPHDPKKASHPAPGDSSSRQEPPCFPAALQSVVESHPIVAAAESMDDLNTAFPSDSGRDPSAALNHMRQSPEHGADDLLDVTTTTKSVLATTRQEDSLRLCDPEPLEEVIPSVDRTMSAKRSSRTLKASRRLLIIDFNEDRPAHRNDDHDPRPISPRHSQHRTLRRKKHLNVTQPPRPALEPIAISLSLPTHTRDLSEPESLASASSDVPTPPASPKVPPAPSTAPSSPVRIGHPSRPYYSAIRKQGISPPSSRPTSLSGPPTTSTSTRPQSYNPPPSQPLASTASTTASRHLSMSSMFVSPPYSSAPSGVFSAFAVVDDDDDGDDDLPMMPPTPAPGRLSFSFTSRPQRSSLGLAPSPRVHMDAQAHSSSHSHSLSLSQGRRSGGFSMSGQTELRMALAVGAASAGAAEEGFRFTETVAPSGSGTGRGVNQNSLVASTATNPSPGSRNSFMGRVKKLRKGIKDMLLMNSTTTTNTSMNSNATTTTTAA
ncbi:unnamed protein product [Cyclocybe aegerita]|uniref:Uncharacterized protein n=1 Tax=Cyclocybe aegerita TaxID=1973307 RepID=A0A8S0XP82_CYCAE|nr:unnamed protein product [Cyclocybe aegerita]